MVFLISYDLNSPGKDYNSLYEEIKQLGNSYKHPMESVWLVAFKSAVSAQSLYDKIRPYIDNNDFLLIVDVTNTDRQGWLAKDVWEWWRTER